MFAPRAVEIHVDEYAGGQEEGHQGDGAEEGEEDEHVAVVGHQVEPQRAFEGGAAPVGAEFPIKDRGHRPERDREGGKDQENEDPRYDAHRSLPWVAD